MILIIDLIHLLIIANATHIFKWKMFGKESNLDDLPTIKHGHKFKRGHKLQALGNGHRPINSMESRIVLQ